MAALLKLFLEFTVNVWETIALNLVIKLHLAGALIIVATVVLRIPCTRIIETRELPSGKGNHFRIDYVNDG